MDFSVLLSDLRDVAEKYKGKSTEPQVSTLAYVDMFTKILKRAQKVTEKYEDQITVLWVALNQLAAIYKDLSPGTARDNLSRFIFGLCAKTVLNIQWSQLDDESKVKKNFTCTIENVHEILTELGFTKFQLIMDLMESHWTHPILTQIMSSDEEDLEGGVEYIQQEDPDILKLRIEIMMKENCEEFALNLCSWSLKHPALTNDLKIKEHQIYMLYKQGEYGKMQEVCESVICHDGIKVMSHLAKIPTNQSLCIRLAQVFLIHDWVKSDRNCCTQELLKLWIHHQYLADKDEERFLDSIWTVAKVSRDTEQIGVLIDGVRRECGDMFIQLYTELCKYALNIDKGNLELEEKQGNMEEVKKRKHRIAKTCVRMAFMLKEYDFRISRISGLTAFSLDPTTENLNLVNKLYWTIKNTSATAVNSKVNPATLYEVERLLGLMRPDQLNPDYSWKQLIPVCKRYKMDYDRLYSNKPSEGQMDGAYQGPVANHTMQSLLQQTAEGIQKHAIKTEETNSGKRKYNQIKSEQDIEKTHAEQLLQSRNLSRTQIEKILSDQFPRNTLKDLSDGPPLTMKQLDKTIDDLKRSIYKETQYREVLEKNLSTFSQAKKTAEMRMQGQAPGSQLDQFQQQQQVQSGMGYVRQQSLPSSSTQSAYTNLLHRQLSQGASVQQQGITQKGQQQPPPAHRSSYTPVTHGQVPGHFSDTGPIQSLSQQLLKKTLSGTATRPNTTRTITHPNILRPPDSSQQECAKIAQHIAEMHEKQRAEKEKLEKIRIQGNIDGAKAVLNSRNVPNSSQISELLSMTIKERKALSLQEFHDRLAGKSASVHVKEEGSVKKYEPKSPSAAAPTTSVTAAAAKQSNSQAPHPTHVVKPPANNQSQNKTKGMKTHKYYLTTEKAMNELKRDTEGNINLGSSKVSIKPVFSMVVPKSMTLPEKKEELVKTVTDMVKKASNVPVSQPKVSPAVSHSQSVSHPVSMSYAVNTTTSIPVQANSYGNTLTVSQSSTQVVGMMTGNTDIKPPAAAAAAVETVNVTPVSFLQQFLPTQTQPQNQFIPTNNLVLSTSVPAINMAQNTTALSADSANMNQTFAFPQPDLQNLNTLANASLTVLEQTNPQPLPGLQGIQQPIQQLFGGPMMATPNQIVAQSLYTGVPSVLPQQSYVTVQSPFLNQNTGISNTQQVVVAQQPTNQIGAQQPTNQIVQHSTHIGQHSSHTVHHPSHIVQQTPQLIHSHPSQIAQHNSAQLVQQTPQLVQQTPQLVQQTPQLVQQTPQLVQQTPQLVQQTPQLVQQTPQLVQQTPQLVQQTPQLVQQTARVQQQQHLQHPHQLVQQNHLQMVQHQQQPHPLVHQQVEKQVPQTVQTQGTIVPSFPASINQSPVSTSLAMDIIPAVSSVSPSCYQVAQSSPQTVGQSRNPTSSSFLTAPELSPAVVQQILQSLKKTSAHKKSPTSAAAHPETVSGNQGAVTSSFSTQSNRQNQNSQSFHNNAGQNVQEKIKQLVNKGDSVSNVKKNILEATQKILQLRKQYKQYTTSGSSDESTNHVVQRRCEIGTRDKPLSMQSPPPQTASNLPDLPDLRASDIDSVLGDGTTGTQPNKQPLARPQMGSSSGEKRIPSDSGDLLINSEQALLCHLEQAFDVRSNTGESTPQAYAPQPGTVSHPAPQQHKQQPVSGSTHEMAPDRVAQSTYLNANRIAKEREGRLQPQTWTMMGQGKDKEGILPQQTPTDQGLKSSEPVECGICLKKFNTLSEIKDHVKKACSNPSTAANLKDLKDFEYNLLYKCTNCNFMSTSEKISAKHVEKCSNVTNSPVKASLNILYRCCMCSEVFSDKQTTYRHVSKLCPRLKVAAAKKDVQDMYHRLKNANVLQSGEKISSKWNTEVKNSRIGNETITKTTHEEKLPTSTSNVGNIKSEKALTSNAKIEDSKTSAIRSLIEYRSSAGENKPFQGFGTKTGHEEANKIKDRLEKKIRAVKTCLENEMKNKQNSGATDENERIEPNSKRHKQDDFEESSHSLDKENSDIEEDLAQNSTSTKHLQSISSKFRQQLEHDLKLKNEKLKKEEQLRIEKLKEEEEQLRIEQLKEKEEHLKNDKLIAKEQKKKMDIVKQTFDLEDMGESSDNETAVPVVLEDRRCYLCGHICGGYYIKDYIKHFVQKHNVGVAGDIGKYRCRYCPWKGPNHFPGKKPLSDHVVHAHKTRLYFIIKRKQLQKEELTCVTEEDIMKQSNTPCHKSENSDKVDKHLKAVAMRKRCAENLKKIASERASVDQESSDNETEQDTNSEFGEINTRQRSLRSKTVEKRELKYGTSNHRSRSSSVSSSKSESSSIQAKQIQKKRSARLISDDEDKGSKLMLTRSGRAIMKQDTDSSWDTESSDTDIQFEEEMDTDERSNHSTLKKYKRRCPMKKNSKENIKRNNKEKKRVSSSQSNCQESSEESTNEEIAPRVTRLASAKGNDQLLTKKQDLVNALLYYDKIEKTSDKVCRNKIGKELLTVADDLQSKTFQDSHVSKCTTKLEGKEKSYPNDTAVSDEMSTVGETDSSRQKIKYSDGKNYSLRNKVSTKDKADLNAVSGSCKKDLSVLIGPEEEFAGLESPSRASVVTEETSETGTEPTDEVTDSEADAKKCITETVLESDDEFKFLQTVHSDDVVQTNTKPKVHSNERKAFDSEFLKFASRKKNYESELSSESDNEDSKKVNKHESSHSSGNSSNVKIQPASDLNQHVNLEDDVPVLPPKNFDTVFMKFTGKDMQMNQNKKRFRSGSDTGKSPSQGFISAYEDFFTKQPFNRGFVTDTKPKKKLKRRASLPVSQPETTSEDTSDYDAFAALIPYKTYNYYKAKYSLVDCSVKVLRLDERDILQMNKDMRNFSDTENESSNVIIIENASIESPAGEDIVIDGNKLENESNQKGTGNEIILKLETSENSVLKEKCVERIGELEYCVVDLNECELSGEPDEQDTDKENTQEEVEEDNIVIEICDSKTNTDSDSNSTPELPDSVLTDHVCGADCTEGCSADASIQEVVITMDKLVNAVCKPERTTLNTEAVKDVKGELQNEITVLMEQKECVDVDQSVHDEDKECDKKNDNGTEKSIEQSKQSELSAITDRNVGKVSDTNNHGQNVKIHSQTISSNVMELTKHSENSEEILSIDKNVDDANKNNIVEQNTVAIPDNQMMDDHQQDIDNTATLTTEIHPKQTVRSEIDTVLEQSDEKENSDSEEAYISDSDISELVICPGVQIKYHVNKQKYSSDVKMVDVPECDMGVTENSISEKSVSVTDHMQSECNLMEIEKDMKQLPICNEHIKKLSEESKQSADIIDVTQKLEINTGTVALADNSTICLSDNKADVVQINEIQPELTFHDNSSDKMKGSPSEDYSAIEYSPLESSTEHITATETRHGEKCVKDSCVDDSLGVKSSYISTTLGDTQVQENEEESTVISDDDNQNQNATESSSRALTSLQDYGDDFSDSDIEIIELQKSCDSDPEYDDNNSGSVILKEMPSGYDQTLSASMENDASKTMEKVSRELNNSVTQKTGNVNVSSLVTSQQSETKNEISIESVSLNESMAFSESIDELSNKRFENSESSEISMDKINLESCKEEQGKKVEILVTESSVCEAVVLDIGASKAIVEDNTKVQDQHLVHNESDIGKNQMKLDNFETCAKEMDNTENPSVVKEILTNTDKLSENGQVMNSDMCVSSVKTDNAVKSKAADDKFEPHLTEGNESFLEEKHTETTTSNNLSNIEIKVQTKTKNHAQFKNRMDLDKNVSEKETTEMKVDSGVHEQIVSGSSTSESHQTATNTVDLQLYPQSSTLDTEITAQLDEEVSFQVKSPVIDTKPVNETSTGVIDLKINPLEKDKNVPSGICLEINLKESKVDNQDLNLSINTDPQTCSNPDILKKNDKYKTSKLGKESQEACIHTDKREMKDDENDNNESMAISPHNVNQDEVDDLTSLKEKCKNLDDTVDNAVKNALVDCKHTFSINNTLENSDCIEKCKEKMDGVMIECSTSTPSLYHGDNILKPDCMTRCNPAVSDTVEPHDNVQCDPGAVTKSLMVSSHISQYEQPVSDVTSDLCLKEPVVVSTSGDHSDSSQLEQNEAEKTMENTAYVTKADQDKNQEQCSQIQELKNQDSDALDNTIEPESTGVVNKEYLSDVSHNLLLNKDDKNVTESVVEDFGLQNVEMCQQTEKDCFLDSMQSRENSYISELCKYHGLYEEVAAEVLDLLYDEILKESVIEYQKEKINECVKEIMEDLLTKTLVKEQGTVEYVNLTKDGSGETRNADNKDNSLSTFDTFVDTSEGIQADIAIVKSESVSADSNVADSDDRTRCKSNEALADQPMGKFMFVPANRIIGNLKGAQDCRTLNNSQNAPGVRTMTNSQIAADERTMDDSQVMPDERIMDISQNVPENSQNASDNSEKHSDSNTIGNNEVVSVDRIIEHSQMDISRDVLAYRLCENSGDVQADKPMASPECLPLDMTISKSHIVSVDKSMDNSQDLPADKSMDNSQDLPADKSIDNSIDLPADTSMDNSQDLPADKSMENSQELPNDESMNNSQDLPAGGTMGNSQDLLGDKIVDNQDLPNDKILDNSQDPSKNKALDNSQDLPDNRISENSQNVPAYGTLDTSQDLPNEKNTDSSQDLPADRNMDKAQYLLAYRTMDNSLDLPADGTMDGSQDLLADGTMDGSQDLPADGTMDGSLDLPADGTMDGSQDLPADGTMDGLQDLPADGSMDGSLDLPADETRDGSQDLPADGTMDGKHDLLADKTMDNSQDLPADGTMDGSQDLPADGTMDGSQDLPADETRDGSKDLPADGTMDGSQDLPADGTMDGKHDLLADKTVDNSQDLPADGTMDGSQDLPADGTMDGSQDLPADGTMDGSQDLPADGTMDGSQDLPADGTMDGSQDLPADGTMDGSQDLPADGTMDGKHDLLAGGTVDGSQDLPADGTMDGSQDRPADGTMDGSQDLPADGTMDGKHDLLADKTMDNSQDLPADGTVDGSQDLSADGTMDGSQDLPADGTMDGSQDLPADGTRDGSQDLPADGTMDGSQDLPADGTMDGSQDRPADGTVDSSQDLPADGTMDGKHDLLADRTMDNSQDLPVDGTIDNSQKTTEHRTIDNSEGLSANSLIDNSNCKHSMEFKQEIDSDIFEKEMQPITNLKKCKDTKGRSGHGIKDPVQQKEIPRKKAVRKIQTVKETAKSKQTEPAQRACNKGTMKGSSEVKPFPAKSGGFHLRAKPKRDYKELHAGKDSSPKRVLSPTEIESQDSAKLHYIHSITRNKPSVDKSASDSKRQPKFRASSDNANIKNSAEKHKLHKESLKPVSQKSKGKYLKNRMNTRQQSNQTLKQESSEEESPVENESLEEFKRRTESVKLAHRKFSCKPYECDFNFEEDGGSSVRLKGNKVTNDSTPTLKLSSKYLQVNQGLPQPVKCNKEQENNIKGKHNLRPSKAMSPSKIALPPVAMKLVSSCAGNKSESTDPIFSPHIFTCDSVKKFTRQMSNESDKVSNQIPTTKPISVILSENLKANKKSFIRSKSPNVQKKVPEKRDETAGNEKMVVSKVRNLRELHKVDKPFEWESGSPVRETRSAIKCYDVDSTSHNIPEKKGKTFQTTNTSVKEQTPRTRRASSQKGDDGLKMENAMDTNKMLPLGKAKLEKEVDGPKEKSRASRSPSKEPKTPNKSADISNIKQTHGADRITRKGKATEQDKRGKTNFGKNSASQKKETESNVKIKSAKEDKSKPQRENTPVADLKPKVKKDSLESHSVEGNKMLRSRSRSSSLDKNVTHKIDTVKKSEKRKMADNRRIGPGQAVKKQILEKSVKKTVFVKNGSKKGISHVKTRSKSPGCVTEDGVNLPMCKLDGTSTSPASSPVKSGPMSSSSKSGPTTSSAKSGPTSSSTKSGLTASSAKSGPTSNSAKSGPMSSSAKSGPTSSSAKSGPTSSSAKFGIKCSPLKCEQDDCSQCNKDKRTMYENRRASVRQIIHKGKVFEIQKGCVTETDIQKQAQAASGDYDGPRTRAALNAETITVPAVVTRKRSRNPEDEISDRNIISSNNINQYISETLKKIRLERENSTNQKWTFQKKKAKSHRYPYSFQKSKSKD